MKNRALIVMAHGSRLENSNEEVRELAAQMGEQPDLQGRYARVVPAFMELGEPSLKVATDALLDQGVGEIDIFPYFLTAGRHIRRDIPQQVAELENQHPDVSVNLLPYLGQQRLALSQVMLQSVISA